jgi:TolA-binding protein
MKKTVACRSRLLSLSLLVVTLILSQTACLTTRSQLKKTDIEGDDPVGATQQAEIKPVEPRGTYALDEVKGEITRLTGRIEDLERARGSEADQQMAEKKRLETFEQLQQRIVELEKTQIELIEQLKAVQGAAQTRSSANASGLLEDAKGRIEEGDREGAIALLDQYLSAPKVTKAEEATFLRAESHYELKQYRKAIADYGQFTEKFTKSKLMPKVLYKIALSFRAISAKEDAKVFLQELIEKHPNSAEAKKARGLLGKQR